MTDFPTLSKKEDQKFLVLTFEDQAIRAPVEGGYELTRPRYTRAPRRIFRTGFSYITEDDIYALRIFWNTVRGGSDGFNYTLPTTSEVVVVRFTKAFTFKALVWSLTHGLLYEVADLEMKEL